MRREPLAEPLEDDALPELIGVGLDQRQPLLLVQRPLPGDLLPVAAGRRLAEERWRIAVLVDPEMLEEQRPSPGLLPQDREIRTVLPPLPRGRHDRERLLIAILDAVAGQEVGQSKFFLALDALTPERTQVEAGQLPLVLLETREIEDRTVRLVLVEAVVWVAPGFVDTWFRAMMLNEVTYGTASI